MKRRDFLNCFGSVLLLGLLGCKTDSGTLKNGYRFWTIQTNYLRPPGALPEEVFLKACINCVICAEVCCRGAIKFITTNLEGKVKPHTPYIIAAETACDLCLECTKVCPTGALMPVAEIESVSMGVAILEENLCLPYINQGGCGACYTVCPVNAVRLEKQRYPKVIADKCVGCGLCEEVCLQKAKAIRVLKV
ncbi:MAG: 4Fe-4S dicluster domain-containing protein [bacterium]